MAQNTNGLVQLLANAQCHLRTSTNWDGSHSQANCCLNYKNAQGGRFDGSESWSASVLDTNQFIVAGCEVPRTFVAVAIQGRGDQDQWVTSYKIRYSLDNVTWFEYRNGAAIPGSSDRNTVQTHFFDTPIRARSVAIHPLTWTNHISLRCEFYTKPVVQSFTQVGQIDSGSAGAMNSGSGERTIVVPVTFPIEFGKVPTVGVTFDTIDSTADSAGQTRVQVVPQQITTKGFNAVFSTWAGSRAYALRCDYVAVAHE